ncbi:Keratin, type II cytoskeletal, putative [Pediculus humanus corporis]|uniref:Keratin, type II cytoskeletal, putative n=1 Tax=Pediculus humanus subsp. corporis TaxID=121224 RepID=E0VRU8_PEDHC|nr:Keratin, type II cytoskeletal, putative [Pediculus humanus corporis]EEB16104.1 Keratin, type II cytoskeletal, putative [Pediculus humanus corporis]
MANDPNRDLLPVKEDTSRGSKGFLERIDHQILDKLPRCELEDKYLRLSDEQRHLKKVLNTQEEKIKRLGTKLLRLVNEKGSSIKNSDQIKEVQELQIKIIELQHENYALKDKNIDMEKNSLDNRKTIVKENIEIIRLQRSLKQQAVKIAALQAEIKNSEANQTILKDELEKARKESDEALQMVSAKEDEILTLNGKLEEKNLRKFEEEELRERVNDLKEERDALKVRNDSLLKAITDSKSDSIEEANEVRKLLNAERKKNEDLLAENLKLLGKKCESEDEANDIRNLLNSERKINEVLEAENLKLMALIQSFWV